MNQHKRGFLGSIESTTRLNLVQLRKPRPWLSLFTLFKEWALIIFCVILCEKLQSPALTLLGIFFISTRIYALTELTHEAIHGNLFNNKKFHFYFQFLYSWPTFVDLSTYGPGHLRHHAKANNLHHDPSTYWLKKEGLLQPMNRKKLFWILVIRPLIGYQAIRELKDLIYFFKSSPSHRKNLLSFWLVIFAIFIYFDQFYILALYWLIPFFWLGTTFRFWKEVEDHYNTFSGFRTVNPNIFYAFFLNPYRCGSHYIHHLEPNIPWHNMKQAENLIKHPKEDVTKSFYGTLMQILQRNKQPKTWPQRDINF